MNGKAAGAYQVHDYEGYAQVRDMTVPRVREVAVSRVREVAMSL